MRIPKILYGGLLMNIRMTTIQLLQEAWKAVKEHRFRKSFLIRDFIVVDAFCGANKDTRMAIRFIVEVAWQAHFVTNMFIQTDRRRT